jgi:hypothetical protein
MQYSEDSGSQLETLAHAVVLFENLAYVEHSALYHIRLLAHAADTYFK